MAIIKCQVGELQQHGELFYKKNIMSLTRVLLISKVGQFKFCSISVTELVLWYRLVTYLAARL